MVLRSMVRMVREGFAILHQYLMSALLHSSVNVVGFCESYLRV